MPRTASVCLVVALLGSWAHAAPPSQQSLIKLFNIDGNEAVADGMFDNMQPMTAQMRQHAERGSTMSEARRRHMDKASDDATQPMRTESSAQKPQAMFVSINGESFPQLEVDGVIAFDAGPVGQACVSRLPQWAQKSMACMQLQMQSLIPRLDKLLKDAAATALP